VFSGYYHPSGHGMCECFELFSINILCIMPADYDLWPGAETMALHPRGDCEGEIIVLARLEFHISRPELRNRIAASFRRCWNYV